MTADAVVNHLRFTVEQFERMGEAMVLDPDERYELLEGEIVMMPPMGPRHAGTVNRGNSLFVSRFAGRATVTVQNPVRLGRRSEPQPDLVVARLRRDFYVSHHPTAEDILLAVEVSDTTLRMDMLVKAPLYARQGVPEVWIVDVAGQALHVHHESDGRNYQSTTTYRGREQFAPQAFADITFTAEDLLGP